MESREIKSDCRPKELFKLGRKNVNLEIGYLFIPFGKTRNAKRRIPFSMRAANILDCRLRETDGNVFVSERTGEPIKSLKKVHLEVIKRSRIAHFRLYDLKHSFASHSVESSSDLITLKDLLGRASLQMVLCYAHPSENHRLTAIKKLEESRLGKSVLTNVQNTELV